MGLAWNTREWLAAKARGEAATGSNIEFHFLSGKELFDETYISADRHHSSAGEWVVLPRPSGFYSVSVVTRPVYALPQELCLTFSCFSREERIGNSTMIGPPIEKVALEFGALLSVLVREPLLPLGVRRQDDKPLMYGAPYGALPRRLQSGEPAQAKGVNSVEFAAILKRLARANAGDVRAALSAAERYHAALSISAFDLSTAYLLLVSAVETLAGHHFKTKKFDFEKVEKFRGVRRLLQGLKIPNGDDNIIEQIQNEILKQEHFVKHKFVRFVQEFLPSRFWFKDGMHPNGYGLPPIPREKLKQFIGKAYDARSDLAHAGIQFPSYVALGARDRIPVRATMDAMKMVGTSKRFVPPFAWFERLTHYVIEEFLVRIVAPEVGKARLERREVLDGMLTKIAALSVNTQKSLETLTRWTARLLGYAIIGPMAPNRKWAMDLESIAALESNGLIRCESCTWEGRASLKDRLIGEAVGEFFWNASDNPFRGNNILEPSEIC